MIFIQGVHHEIQHDGNSSRPENERSIFKNYLKDRVSKLNIALLAEEFNQEALECSQATESTVKSVADELKLRHRFCEANKKQRAEMGILCDNEIRKKLGLPPQLTSDDTKKIDEEKKKFYRKREQFWFDGIKNKLQANMIFVCGLGHVNGFQAILRENGVESIILDKKF